jgi:hypothetical protein
LALICLSASLAIGVSNHLAGSASAVDSGDDVIPVRVDERVELLSVLFRLLGAREYSQTPRTVPYAKEADEHFGPFKDHDVVKLARKLRQERGISFDAVASFALHIRGGPRLDSRIPFDQKPLDLDRRWSPESATEFLTTLQRFADDTKAFEFFERHRELYTKSAGRLAQELTRRPYRPWLDRFFGAKPGAKFCAIIGMLNGSANFGCRLRYPDGREEILPVIGASKFDDSGLPTFDAQTAGIIAHEFCHSYCNPLVDRFADKLLPSAEKIFPRRAELLKLQAYTSSRIMLYESLVRACTHRFLSAHGTPGEAAAELQDDIRRGFFWTPELSKLLHDYEDSRQKYGSLEAFMPQVVRFFEDLGGSIDSRLAQFPHVTGLVPKNGATDVDPSLTELRIEFDRPMYPRSWALGDGQMPAFPAKGRFSDDARTFIQPVNLEPGKTYTFFLNSIWRHGFRSADGLPLDPVRVTFTTAKP